MLILLCSQLFSDPFGDMSTHRCRKRIREAKRKARPELSTGDLWVQHDYANNFDLNVEVNDTLERIHVKNVSPRDFIDRCSTQFLYMNIQ